MADITGKGPKDYLHCLARVGDAAGFLREDVGDESVYLYLYHHKNEVKTYRFKEGDEITIWTSNKQSLLAPKKFRYAE